MSAVATVWGSPATKRCRCGKVGWPSEQLADDVVVRAKIAYSLRGNNRRREQRSYRCPEDQSLFHVTSQSDRRDTKPWWSPDDDDTARDFIIQAVFTEDTRMRGALLNPGFIDQTKRVLDDLNAGLNERLQMSGGELARPERKRLQVACNVLAPWRTAAHEAVRARNVAGSHSRAAEEKFHVTRALRELAVAVAEHERVNPAPDAGDRRLYDLLAELRLPGAVTQPSLRDLLDTGAWH